MDMSPCHKSTGPAAPAQRTREPNHVKPDHDGGGKKGRPSAPKIAKARGAAAPEATRAEGAQTTGPGKPAARWGVLASVLGVPYSRVKEAEKSRFNSAKFFTGTALRH